MLENKLTLELEKRIENYNQKFNTQFGIKYLIGTSSFESELFSVCGNFTSIRHPQAKILRELFLDLGIYFTNCRGGIYTKENHFEETDWIFTQKKEDKIL